MGKFILIVDDNLKKLEEAERAVLAVFPDAEVWLLLYSYFDTRRDAELAWSIYQVCPDILVLDNDLASRAHGTTVALRLRMLPRGRLIQIVMYTTEWERGIRSVAGRQPLPDVRYGAATAEALQIELERLKADKFSGE